MYANLNYLSLGYAIFHSCLCLVNVSSSFGNSIEFIRLWRLVIKGDWFNLTDITLALKLTNTCQRATITNIDSVNVVVYHHNHECTAAWLISNLTVRVHTYLVDKILLRFFCSKIDCKLYIVWEVWLQYDVVVKVVL